MKQRPNKTRMAGWTMVELLVIVAIIVALAGIAVPVMSSAKKRAYRAHALTKLEALGGALVSYAADHAGNLPWEDAPGSDDWQAAAEEENYDVWYNALPPLMGAKPMGDLASNPEQFYDESYPLYLPGAGYPENRNKRLGKPYFAMAMNSRLQRKDGDGVKQQGRLSQVLVASRTVAFLECGMPGEKKTAPGQRGFDASPKANPRSFVARYNGKGLLVFLDGHVESFEVSDLIHSSGDIVTPQRDVVWTYDPDDDPN